MMSLVFFLQASQYRDGGLFVRLVNHHYLETAFESLIFLKILLVLVKCCCANSTQLATSKSRFQDVGGIHRAFATAGTDKSVNLIDKQDDITITFNDFLDNGFQSFLKLTLIHCAGDESTHIQRIHVLHLQVLRDIATNNTFC